MYIIKLTFNENKDRAREFIDAHNQWIQQGFDDDVFVLVGSLADGKGGLVQTRAVERAELDERLQQDPLISENIVSVEIIELTAKRAEPRLQFLIGE